MSEYKDRLEKPLCPNCGSRGECSGRDVGGVNYEDYFVFWCTSCGHVMAERVDGGYLGYGDHFNTCVFCGVDGTNAHGLSEPEDVRELMKSFGTGVLRQGAAQTVTP